MRFCNRHASPKTGNPRRGASGGGKALPEGRHGPLCAFVEQRYFQVFHNRDYLWAEAVPHMTSPARQNMKTKAAVPIHLLKFRLMVHVLVCCGPRCCPLPGQSSTRPAERPNVRWPRKSRKSSFPLTSILDCSCP